MSALLAVVIGGLFAWLGFIGIEHHLGIWFAWGAILLSFVGFALPLTIGSYFGAVDVMSWPWWVGVSIACPGVGVAIALLFSGLPGSIVRHFR